MRRFFHCDHNGKSVSIKTETLLEPFWLSETLLRQNGFKKSEALFHCDHNGETLKKKKRLTFFCAESTQLAEIRPKMMLSRVWETFLVRKQRCVIFR